MGGVSLVEFQGQFACLVGWRLLTPPPLLWPEERGKNRGAGNPGRRSRGLDLCPGLRNFAPLGLGSRGGTPRNLQPGRLHYEDAAAGFSGPSFRRGGRGCDGILFRCW